MGSLKFKLPQEGLHIMFSLAVLQKVAVGEGQILSEHTGISPRLSHWGTWSSWTACNEGWKQRSRYGSDNIYLSHADHTRQAEARICDSHWSQQDPRRGIQNVPKVPSTPGTQSITRVPIRADDVGSGKQGTVCPSGFRYWYGRGRHFENGTVRPSCYKVNDERSSWTLAEASCKDAGGNLVSIESLEEQMHIIRLLKEYPGGIEFWTSGLDMEKEGRWVWTAIGEKIIFSFWYRGEPNNGDIAGEDYLAVGYGPSREWSDLGPARQRSFICEVPVC